MTTIPPEAIQAAAEALERKLLTDPPGDCMTWLEADEVLAQAALEAAEKVWPHTPPVRSPESTVAAVTDRAPAPSFRRPPARTPHPFGFGLPPDVTA